MAGYKGELGLQFVTHLANHYTVPDLVRLAALAHEKGFDQIWINDNIRYRGQMVILTAIAARVPIRLGHEPPHRLDKVLHLGLSRW